MDCSATTTCGVEAVEKPVDNFYVLKKRSGECYETVSAEVFDPYIRVQTRISGNIFAKFNALCFPTASLWCKQERSFRPNQIEVDPMKESQGGHRLTRPVSAIV